jgi:4,5-DOPA dioxygenase extradiol
LKRKEFIKSGIILTAATATSMKLSVLNTLFADNKTTKLMPVLFVGHGNPMNAIEENEFSLAWKKLGKELPKPNAVLCISAHWLTKGTWVTAMEKPKTIHDFGGFPDKLFQQQYPAPGAPRFAKETITLIQTTRVNEDYNWGLDHGTWSVLLPMYPQAEIPVYQLSLDYTKNPQYHYNLAKELFELRKKGVLIIGSGNIVHNLSRLKWTNDAFDWALEFDAQVKKLIDQNDFQSLINYEKLGEAAKLSVPANDHYLPLLYSLALKCANDNITYFNDKVLMGAVSMRSLLIH